MFRMFFSVLAVIFRCKVLKIDNDAGLMEDGREEVQEAVGYSKRYEDKESISQ